MTPNPTYRRYLYITVLVRTPLRGTYTSTLTFVDNFLLHNTAKKNISFKTNLNFNGVGREQLDRGEAVHFIISDVHSFDPFVIDRTIYNTYLFRRTFIYIYTDRKKKCRHCSVTYHNKN